MDAFFSSLIKKSRLNIIVIITFLIVVRKLDYFQMIYFNKHKLSNHTIVKKAITSSMINNVLVLTVVG